LCDFCVPKLQWEDDLAHHSCMHSCLSNELYYDNQFLPAAIKQISDRRIPSFRNHLLPCLVRSLWQRWKAKNNFFNLLLPHSSFGCTFWIHHRRMADFNSWLAVCICAPECLLRASYFRRFDHTLKVSNTKTTWTGASASRGRHQRQAKLDVQLDLLAAEEETVRATSIGPVWVVFHHYWNSILDLRLLADRLPSACRGSVLLLLNNLYDSAFLWHCCEWFRDY